MVSCVFLKRLCVLTLMAGFAAGCGRFNVVACEGTERYELATEAGPVQVPDGLTPPDQSRALQIPNVPAETKPVKKRGECLESPPEYFEDGLPT